MLTMLQTLCIKTIVEHIDIFCAAYRSTDTAIPQRHFEFLQRIYSQNLITTLSDERKLGNKHLDLLINKHVKEFNLEHFEKCDWEIVEEKLLHIGDTIVKLTATTNQKHIGSAALGNIIHQSRNLESLNLTGFLISDDILTEIGRFCRSLKVLDISECESVTSKGLLNLFSVDANKKSLDKIELKCLNVFNTKIDDTGIVFVLKNIPTLEILHYKDLPKVLCEIHKKNSKKNSPEVKEYNLTTLDLDCDNHKYSVTDMLSACTVLCPRIKKLTVSLLTENDLNLCSKFLELENISLTGKGVLLTHTDKISINSFLETRGLELRNLELCCFSISVSVLSKSCPKLKQLILKDMDFVNSGEWNLSPLSFLQSLCFEDAIFYDEYTENSVVSLLNCCPSLEVLRFPHSEFNIQELNKAILKHMNSLKEIDFSFSDVEMPFLESLLIQSSVLKKLNIDFCDHITRENVNDLTEMVLTMKSSVEIVWRESESDYTYSDYDDEDLFDDVYDDSDYGYDAYDGADVLFHMMDEDFEDII